MGVIWGVHVPPDDSPSRVHSVRFRLPVRNLLRALRGRAHARDRS